MPTIKKGIARVYGYEEKANKDQVNGYPSLDAGGKVPVAELPTGAGFGLDADTVDTYHASAFLFKGGGIIGAVRSQSSDVIVTATDYLLNVSTIGINARTVTFPAASENTGQMYIVRRNSSTAGSWGLTLQSSTGALFNGVATYVMYRIFEVISVQFVGPDWVIVPVIPKFLQLTDVAGTYSTTRRFVRINYAATGIDFATRNSIVGQLAIGVGPLNAFYDFMTADASAGAINPVLDDNIYGQLGQEFTIVKIDSTFNAVTISTSTNKYINGYLNPTLDMQWQSMTLIFDGTEYVIA